MEYNLVGVTPRPDDILVLERRVARADLARLVGLFGDMITRGAAARRASSSRR